MVEAENAVVPAASTWNGRGGLLGAMNVYEVRGNQLMAGTKAVPYKPGARAIRDDGDAVQPHNVSRLPGARVRARSRAG